MSDNGNVTEFYLWKKAFGFFFLLIIVCWPLEGKSVEFEETVIRTGVQGESNGYAVSPDGSRILFITRGTAYNSLRLLDVKSGRVSKIPEEAGRTWEMPAWSRDGKQVVAVSTALREGKYQVGEQEVILIDPRDWSHRKLAATPGVNIFPFFSADGRTVYYFKGKKREKGKTPASRYDLYAYELATDRETRLTYEVMHQVNQGYDDGNEVLFSVHGFHSKKAYEGGLYALNKGTRQFRHFNVDQSSGFFQIRFGDKDTTGNIYFIAAKNRPNGGNYLWFVYRCDTQGNNCVAIGETIIGSRVQVASGTGEVFINAVTEGEIIFRQLIEKSQIQ
jgi:dipeptidyl aminopeptidase/acylaminoacyl peptidase